MVKCVRLLLISKKCLKRAVLILAIEVCAAFNGMVFKSFGHERMNKSLSLLSLEQV